MVVAIEDREADADQRRARVALEIFAVGVADKEIDRLREQQRTHVPQILAGIDVAILAERRAVEQRLHLFRPGLAAVGRENVGRLGAEFQQEAREAEAEIGIAIDRELLAVDMGARIRDGVDQPAALLVSPPGSACR